MLLFAGDVTTATALTDEGRAVIDATRSQFAPYAAMGLAALQGSQAEVSALIEATASDVALRGEGIAMSVAKWANALLHNGLGRYPAAMRAADMSHRAEHEPDPGHPAEQRDADVPRLHQAGAHLWQQRKIQEVISRVDHRDLGRSASHPGQLPRGVITGEASSDQCPAVPVPPGRTMRSSWLRELRCASAPASPGPAADDQHFEYLGCHPGTGLLRVLPATVAG